MVLLRFRAWDKETKNMNGMAEIYRNRNQEIELRPRDEDIILMQSTGLKDKNGKEIFEGDVVRMRNPRDRRQIGMFQVVRVANSPVLGLLDKKLTTEIFNLYEHMRDYYEILGNIYENPELLEVE